MPKQLFDSASAREAGKRSGKARRQQKLTLTLVEAELGSLETLEDAQRRLDKIGRQLCYNGVPVAFGALAVVKAIGRLTR